MQVASTCAKRARVYFLILDFYFEDTVWARKAQIKPAAQVDFMCSVRILLEVSINYVAHCDVMVTEHNE